MMLVYLLNCYNKFNPSLQCLYHKQLLSIVGPEEDLALGPQQLTMPLRPPVPRLNILTLRVLAHIPLPSPIRPNPLLRPHRSDSFWRQFTSVISPRLLPDRDNV